jgi:hypothetical protein
VALQLSCAGTPSAMACEVSAQDLSQAEEDDLRRIVAEWEKYKIGREVVKKVGNDKVCSTIMCYSCHSAGDALPCSIAEPSTATCTYS